MLGFKDVLIDSDGFITIFNPCLNTMTCEPLDGGDRLGLSETHRLTHGWIEIRHDASCEAGCAGLYSDGGVRGTSRVPDGPVRIDGPSLKSSRSFARRDAHFLVERMNAGDARAAPPVRKVVGTAQRATDEHGDDAGANATSRRPNFRRLQRRTNPSTP
jgi:hypothetical protein